MTDMWDRLRSGRVRAFVVLALGAAVLTGWGGARLPSADGTIGGRVDLKRSQVIVEERPNSASLGATLIRPAELRPAVVFLDTAPRGAFEPDESVRATMKQQDQTFVPHVLAITVGTTVDFPNADLTFHNVFSLSKANTFDLGRYPRGTSRAVRFDRPGVVQVFCEIHSHMRGFILVFAHRYFAVTDPSGHYSIGRIPPGSYTLDAWYEGDVRETRPVVVPESGGDVVADFVIR